jgi:hypothetical protein
MARIKEFFFATNMPKITSKTTKAGVLILARGNI